jgi:hypothetical protein
MKKAALQGNPDAQKGLGRSSKTTLLVGFTGILKLAEVSDQSLLT